MKSVAAELDNPPNLPHTLYHYSSLTGAIGIVTSHELWATKIQFLNDTRELVSATQNARQSMEFALHGSTNEFHIRVYAQCLEALERLDNAEIYVASFSEEEDLLSQWRAYCLPAGVSIGFNSERLAQLCESQGFVLAPCIYDSVLQEELISDTVRGAVAAADDLRQGGHALFLGTPVKTIDQLGKQFAKHIMSVAPLMKDASFAEEREWRLISGDKPLGIKKRSFRASRYTIAPYYRFSLGAPATSPIRWAVIGPSPQRHATTSSFSTLCMQNGVNCFCSSSRTPYRDW